MVFKAEIYSGELSEKLQSIIKMIVAVVTGLEGLVGPKVSSLYAKALARHLYGELGLDGLDPGDALRLLNRSPWRLDVYEENGSRLRGEDGGWAAYLIARECPIRQALYQEDLPPGGLLCSAMGGVLSLVFSRAVEGARVELTRYGPNACLLRLGMGERWEPPAAVSERPGVEEYAGLLWGFYTAFTKSMGRALEETLGNAPITGYRAARSYGFREGAALLAELGRSVGLEEAIDVINSRLGRFVRVGREDDLLLIEGSGICAAVAECCPQYRFLANGVVRGFLAGLLSALTGERLNLAVAEEFVLLKVIKGG